MMSKKSENQSNELDGGPLPGAEGADTDGELIDLDLADAEGMKLALERCEALHSSASGMLARRKCELLDVRAERRLRTARVRSDLRLKGIKNDMEIQDALTLDPQHREVSAHERMLEAEVITLEAEVERQEKRWDTISRSAELRRQEIQLHRGPFVPGLKGGRK
jgi:hypothetical protein